MTIDLASTTAPSFAIKMFSSSAEATLLNYTVSTSTLTLDTSNAGYGQASNWSETTVLNSTEADQLLTTNSSISTQSHGAFGRVASWSTTVATPGGVLELDILLDRTSLEIFAADGSALTAAIYPRYQESNQIELVVEDGAVAVTNITMTPFGSMWA